MSTLLTTLFFVGIIVLALGVSLWLFLGFMIFLGAAMIPDLHDDYLSNEDSDEYDRKNN